MDMEYMGCYDSVVEVIGEAEMQFEHTHTLNKDKYNELEEVCDAIDSFVKEICCNFVDVSVDSNSKRLTIDIGCDSVIFYNGRSSQFFELIQMVDSFSFSKTKDGGLCIALNIDGILEREHG